MDSKVSKENYLNYLELFLQDVPPEKWAVVACRMMTLDVLEMFFGSTMKTPDISQMTWEDFKTKFVALNTGPLITTIYGNMMAMDALYYRNGKPFELSWALREADTIINRLGSHLNDATKIYFVLKTLPPYLRNKVAYAPDGRDHADYASFRVNPRESA
jgi:hypothetical protein